MDLAVRLSSLSALATLLTIILTWRAGLWLLLGLPCYALTYVFYRGAVAQAHGYGTALKTLVDLNRLALYERLGMPQPETTHSERQVNAALGELIRDQAPVYLRLKGQSSADT